MASARVWKSTRKTSFFSVAFLPALADGQAAGHVDGDGLGDVDVLAGLDGGRRLLGMEVGRGLDDHGVELALQEFLVAGKAGEARAAGMLSLSPTALAWSWK